MRRRSTSIRSIKNPEVAAERLTEAIELWRGRPFDGIDAAVLVPTVTRLEEGRLSALEDRFEAQLAMGKHSALTGELEAMVVDHPLRERLWGQLMTALYRSGRQGEALRAYQRARMVLGEELGIEPSAELRDIEDLILQQAPELDAPTVDEGAVGGAKLEIEGPEGVAFSFELLASSVSVGRVTSGRGPDIALDDPSVSRLQCTLEQEFGAWWVSDDGSRNGTFLRHKGETSRIDGRVRIDHGDALVVPGATGEWTLVLEDPHSTVRL